MFYGVNANFSDCFHSRIRGKALEREDYPSDNLSFAYEISVQTFSLLYILSFLLINSS